MTLSELTATDLLSLSTLLDQYQAAKGGADSARWRELVHAEVARRFARVEEATRLMDEARAARGA